MMHKYKLQLFILFILFFIINITSTSAINRELYPYLHGHEIKENDNGRVDNDEFFTYIAELDAGDELFIYVTIKTGSLLVLINYGEHLRNDRKDMDTFRTSVISNINNNQTLPSGIVNYAIVENSNTNMSYTTSDEIDIQIIILSFNTTMNDHEEALFYMYTSHPITGDATGSWFNRWFINWIKDTPLNGPPFSTVFLISVSFSISLLSAGVTRLLIDLDEINKMQKKITDHNKLKRKAQETADKKLWAKVQAKDSTITTMQQKMMFKRMLPQFLLTIPFFLIFTTLRGTMGIRELNLTPDRGGIVAVLPFQVPTWFPIFGQWFSKGMFDPTLSVAGFGSIYFLSAIVASMIIQKVIGFNLQGVKQENPFKR
jgi:uncharacterized membrane protein (DUF106 family)